MKAYLELEMPENCYECNLCATSSEDGTYCIYTGESTVLYNSARKGNCPLQPVKEVEKG